MSDFKIMFVADICGKAGRQAAAHLVKPLREELNIDCVIANVENSAGGFGVTPEMSQKIFSYGVDIQTSGNHIWDRVQIIDYINATPKLLRPANYPHGTPGNGAVIETFNGNSIGVINLMGRTFMHNIDCPFKTADRLVNKMQEAKIIFVDIHAEATSEKQALAYYLDGKVSAVVGTHTHVPTADEHVSKRGTAYITDAGMTGPLDSILGMEKGPALGRFLTGMPKRFTTASEEVFIQGVIINVNADDGAAISIERFKRPFDISEIQNGNMED